MAAPKIFTLMFAMIRPLLTQVTLDKVRLFGEDRNEWTSALLEEIDADQLPVHYGGTMTDPDGDPKCPSKVSIQHQSCKTCWKKFPGTLPVRQTGWTRQMEHFDEHFLQIEVTLFLTILRRCLLQFLGNVYFSPRLRTKSKCELANKKDTILWFCSSTWGDRFPNRTISHAINPFQLLIW